MPSTDSVRVQALSDQANQAIGDHMRSLGPEFDRDLRERIDHLAAYGDRVDAALAALASLCLGNLKLAHAQRVEESEDAH